MNGRVSKFIKTVLVILAILNLVFLFGFDYRIPSWFHLPFEFGKSEDQEEQVEEEVPQEETVQEEPEETAAQEPEAVSEEEPAAAQEEEKILRCVITEPGESNIRSGPGTDNDVIDALPTDTILVITGEAVEGWLPIKTEDGTEGYIYQDLVRMLEDEAEGQSSENADETTGE